VKPSFAAAHLAVPIAVMLCACSHDKPPAEAPRPVRTVELRYDKAAEANRYVGTVQARHEEDEAFRVGGKVAKRMVEVGQSVREGGVIAVLDDTDYRLAEEAARQQLAAVTAQARQAESDRQRLAALKIDGSVSASDDEQAHSRALTTQATAEAQARQLELALNRLKYTVLRASRSGVVTSRKFEVGQVIAEGQPVVSIADEGEPEIVVDVPEDQLAGFKKAQFKASLASAPDETFEVVLRELSPQAAATTRTYRARLKPGAPKRLALGATATLVAEYPAGDESVAVIPASAITQSNGQPAIWVVRRTGDEPAGAADLIHVTVHGYRNDQVLVSGPPPGALIVTAGVQKMAPGLRVALSDSARSDTSKQAAR
jgi:membrane fusion protein, multidrug efflux system